MFKQVNVINDMRIWQDYLNRSEHATYAQTPEWYKIWQSYYHLSWVGFEFVCFSGARFFLPVFLKPYAKGLGKIAQISVQGLGGILGEQAMGIEMHHYMFRWLTQRFSNVEGVVSPYGHIAPSLFAKRGPHYTHVIFLKTEHPILKKPLKKQKQALRQARKAARLGVTIRPGRASDWDTYEKLYKQSQERWKNTTQTYTTSFFKQIALANSQHPILWVAEYEEKIVSATLCFIYGQHACYWHGVADHNYFHTGATTLLHHEIMNTEGLRWYDLNASAGLASVERFKESLGAVAIPLWRFRRHSRLYELYLEKSGFFS